MNSISHRETWAEISLDAVYHNVRTFKSNLRDDCRLMAVVKANGYGHGAVETAKTALKAKADYLAVAILDEALQLREAGIHQPILIVGYVPPSSIETAILHDVTLTVYSDSVLEEVMASSERLQKTARIHLKADTGMTRLGVTSKEEALSLAAKAKTARFVELEGLFTHFASADSPDPAYTRQQFQRFQSYIEFLREKQIEIPIKHCCNSAATMNFPDMHLDMVRVGISLYGLFPSEHVQRDAFPLEQAMQLKTKVAAVKTVCKGQPVSYGCTFVPEQDSVIATLPIGYADGLSRQLSNQGSALIQGQRVPIIGRVCMDQSMIDVTSVPEAQVGDEVTLFGKSNGEFLFIDEVAAYMNTINYEVVCLISKRVPRVYTRNGKIVGECFL